MKLLIIIAMFLAVFCLILFIFGLQRYLKTQNRKTLTYSITMLGLVIAWSLLAMLSYFNYLQQMSL